MSEWIKVSDKLPDLADGDNDCSIEVLVSVVDDFDGKRKVAQGFYSREDEDWYTADGDLLEYCEVTHWQPLPTPPAELPWRRP